KATRISPREDAGSHNWYAFLLTMSGYAEEARKQLDISKKLCSDTSAKVDRFLGQTYYVERNFTKAIEHSTNALSLDAHEGVALNTIGCVYEAMGDYSNAIYHFELADTNGQGGIPKTRKLYDQLRRAFTDKGPTGYWQERLQ